MATLLKGIDRLHVSVYTLCDVGSIDNSKKSTQSENKTYASESIAIIHKKHQTHTTNTLSAKTVSRQWTLTLASQGLDEFDLDFARSRFPIESDLNAVVALGFG